MKIGFNLLLWSGMIDQSHYPLLDKLKAAGYDGVEIPCFGGEVKHYETIGKAIAERDLECTSVTIIPDEAHNPLSADAAVRAAAVAHLNWALECSAALGSKLLMGPYHQPLGVFTGDGPTAEEKKRAAEVHHQAAEIAATYGIQMTIEPLNRFECYFINTLADAAAHVKRVDHPNFATMYDSFHANIEEKDPVGVIAPHIGVIQHVHISENDRGTPGRGHVPFKEILAALKGAGYDGWLTIEAIGRALPDLAAATRVWRDFFSSPEEVYSEGIKLIRENI